MGYTVIDGVSYESEMVEKLEQAFAESDKTDAILVVSGKKLHVNKALLSYHSDYFKTLFNSEFKEKTMEDIPIEDVNYGDFAMLLSLVHDKPFGFRDYDVEDLLKLADRFLLGAPKLLLEHFIINSQDFTRHEKLELADKYNLENLLEHALGLYNSKEAFADLSSSGNRNFSDNLKLKIFNKLFENYDIFFK